MDLDGKPRNWSEKTKSKAGKDEEKEKKKKRRKRGVREKREKKKGKGKGKVRGEKKGISSTAGWLRKDLSTWLAVWVESKDKGNGRGEGYRVIPTEATPFAVEIE